MANYCCTTRTNYFHVKDPDAFRAFAKRIYGADTVYVWEESDKEGNLVFSFGCYGAISGLRNEQTTDIPAEDIDLEAWMNGEYDDDDENTYDAMLDGLQEHIANDDAIIIFQTGYEKLRYVQGVAEIITSQQIYEVSLREAAINMARQALGDKNWTSSCEY